jgi:hypothetical protein
MRDSCKTMFRGPRPRALARMPSTQAYPLNPRAAPPVGVPMEASQVKGSDNPRMPIDGAVLKPSASDLDLESAQARARAGGFHESSYELKQGLEITESEWLVEATIPGALGDH